ncbi:MAG: superoxide dismutase [Candidatus Nealsonbacteria bacterium]|nr:superoxide dismutase [Candidatus Nealsonbacteria bacterium]
MKNYGEIKNLPFKELKGISQKTIDIHWGKLYQGYVKKWQEIMEKLEKIDLTQANATYSEARELKVEQTFAANAVLLHEAYFDILGGDGKPGTEKIIETIARDYDSFDNWLTHFKALGMASRGWVVLAYDFNDGKLRNYIADAHNLYGIWGAAPIVVLDMYEHAYFIDFGSDKKAYIEAYFQNLNWQKIGDKYNKIVGK